MDEFENMVSNADFRKYLKTQTFVNYELMPRENFNVKFKMKPVAGREVRREVVSHCVERGETEASKGGVEGSICKQK